MNPYRSSGHGEFHIGVVSQVVGDLVIGGELHTADEVVRGVRALSLLGQARHPPHDGAVLVLIFGLPAGHFHQTRF